MTQKKRLAVSKGPFKATEVFRKPLTKATEFGSSSGPERQCTYINSERERVTTIEPTELERTYLICVTRDDFGPIAVNLSLLLEKEEEDPYPWAVNILDLHNLIDAWDYFGWGVDQLVKYLDLRVDLHGNVYASDELEIAGFFIKHGGLEPLVAAEADLLQLSPMLL